MLLMLYRLLMFIVRPFYVSLILPKRIKLGKEDPVRFCEKLGRATIERPVGQVLWIHAASVGESLSVKPLIDSIIHRYPQWHILMTTVTKSGGEIVKMRMNDKVIHQYLPLDFQNYVNNFLNHWRPDCVLWLESEFWPTMLFRLKDLNIPTLSLNTRISAVSLKYWQFFKKSFLKILNCFDYIFPQTLALEASLKKMGVKNVNYIGNLKFCAVSGILNQNNYLTSLTDRGFNNDQRLIWLASSTHSGEEEQIIAAHKTLKKKYSTLLTVIAPRHPYRTEMIKNSIIKNDLSCQLWSQNTMIDLDTDIVIIDQIGILMQLYAHIKVVFIGGSLVPVGGHNVIEPASQECAIIHGPYMDNFLEIVALFNQFNALTLVNNDLEIIDVITGLFEDLDLMHQKQRNALEVVRQQQSVLNYALDALDPYLRDKYVAANP